MNAPLRIVGIAGSLRRQSYSRMVLRTVLDDLMSGAATSELDLAQFPLYSEDIEHEALPGYVSLARTEVTSADVVVIVTPEFNHGIPGVLKNALDWLSRPAFNSCMAHKPVMFMTIGPGALGGVRAQYQLRETLASMHCRLAPLSEIVFPHIAQKVSESKLTDVASLQFVSAQIERMLELARLRHATPNAERA